jgi:hypothetical protein
MAERLKAERRGLEARKRDVLEGQRVLDRAQGAITGLRGRLEAAQGIAFELLEPAE